MEAVATSAFVLRTRNFGESDCIVVLLTEVFGKISAVAKGARRSKKRFGGGALEPFQELTVRVVVKPHRNLGFLQESRIDQSWSRVALDMETFGWSSYLTELTELFTPEAAPCPDVFALYGETLRAMAPPVGTATEAIRAAGIRAVEIRAAEIRAAVTRATEVREGTANVEGRGNIEESGNTEGTGDAEALAPATLPVVPRAHHFILSLLDCAGWAPDFTQCGLCSEPISEDSRPILDHRGSGVICSRHEAEKQGISADDPRFRPSRRVIHPELLAYLRMSREECQSAAPPEITRLASALLHRLIDIHLPRPPRSRSFLNSLTDSGTG